VDNFSKIKNFSLDLVFPRFCFGCQKEGTYLCNDCRSLLDISEFNYCLCDRNPQQLLPQQKSGKPFGTAQGKCNRCQNKILSGLYFALPYKEKQLTKKLIHNFKYKPYIKDLAETLSSVLIEHFIKTNKNTNEIWENSVLVPVPLDKTKLKIRGYNQSAELAKELAKVLQIPVVSDVLIKVKHTDSQMELSKVEREKNLQGVFAISPTRHSGESQNPECLQCSWIPGPRLLGGQEARNDSEDLYGKKIFLVDDVYTTGATMQECAKILKESGAKQVWGIAIAREG